MPIDVATSTTAPADAAASRSRNELVYLEADTAPERQGVYYLVLNRPTARNAISRAVLTQLLACLHVVRAQLATPPASAPFVPTIRVNGEGAEWAPLPRVLIVRANGPAFCAGADLKERAGMSDAEVALFLHNLRSTLDAMEALPIPTLAAIDGAALGGGLELALTCDFRVAAQHVAAIGFPEVRLGIIPGAGGTQRCPRVVGLVCSLSALQLI